MKQWSRICSMHYYGLCHKTFIEFGGFKWPKTVNLTIYCAMKRICTLYPKNRMFNLKLMKVQKAVMKKISIYSHLKGPLVVGSETISDDWKPFKNYDVISIIVLTFWSKKIMLISKFITSQSGKQITLHTFSQVNSHIDLE